MFDQETQCTQKGCSYPINCETCGFNRAVLEERKKIPLQQDKDGLWRKHIPKKGGEPEE